jgi:hypothetical protein
VLMPIQKSFSLTVTDSGGDHQQTCALPAVRHLQLAGVQRAQPETFDER